MRLMPVLFAAVLAGAAGSASAGTLDLNLSNDAVRFGAAQPLTETGLELSGDWLHHEDNGDVLGAGLLLVDEAEPRRGALTLGAGAKLVYVNGDGGDADGQALGIGGRFRYTWPTFNRFGVGGQLYYAPSVTAGGDLDRYLEAALRAEYRVLRNADAYLGVRSVRVGEEGGDTDTFESGLHAGIRLSF